MKNNIKIVLKNLFILLAVVSLYTFGAFSVFYAEKVFGVYGVIASLVVAIILCVTVLSLNDINYNKKVKELNEKYK